LEEGLEQVGRSAPVERQEADSSDLGWLLRLAGKRCQYDADPRGRKTPSRDH
jgi:hypothetical protein